MKALLVLGAAVSVLAANACPPSDCSKAPLKNNKICDTSLSPTERAAALVAAMTQSEKIVNLVRQASPATRVRDPPMLTSVPANRRADLASA
jgi:xylan 1,4-beta-xylosidase